MSFVDVSPSTDSWFQVRDAAPASSVAKRRRIGRRVGEDDREHRGHPRVDHADALGDAAHRDRRRTAVRAPAPRRGSSPSSSWSRSSGARRRRPRAPRRSRRATPPATRAIGCRDEVDRQPRADDARRQVEHLGGGAADGRRHRLADRRLVGVAVAVPVAAFAEPDVAMTARAYPAAAAPPPVAARFARDSRTGAAANRLGVVTAAAGTGPSDATIEREVRVARRLDARRGRPDREPGRAAARRARPRAQRRGAARGAGRSRGTSNGPLAGDGSGGTRQTPAGQGPSGSWSRPAVSGRPWTTLNAWIAWPAAPLTRLSRTPMARIAAVALVDAAPDSGLVRAQDMLRRRRRVDDGHERLVAVRVAVQLVELGLGDRPGRPDVARGQDPAGHRDEVGEEVDAADARVRPVAAQRAQLLLDLADVAVGEDPVRLDALVDLAELEVRPWGHGRRPRRRSSRPRRGRR